MHTIICTASLVLSWEMNRQLTPTDKFGTRIIMEEAVAFQSRRHQALNDMLIDAELQLRQKGFHASCAGAACLLVYDIICPQAKRLQLHATRYVVGASCKGLATCNGIELKNAEAGQQLCMRSADAQGCIAQDKWASRKHCALASSMQPDAYP